LSPLTFVVPGPLDQTTGGYLFDRQVVDGARALGREVRVIELPGRFPDADEAACAAAAASLADLPDAGAAVIDGLALPAYAGCIARHAARLRLIGFIHHPLSLETGLTPAKAGRYAAIEARLWPCMHGFVCPSAATARALLGAGVAAARIAVVAPGTHQPVSRGRGRAADDACVRLLAVGTVSARKGYELLIEALAALRHLAWRLVCIGSLARSPQYAAALRAAIARTALGERVTLAGELPPERVERAYRDADVFVLASHHEGYGMAYAEALAHGLPIVATTAGAIPDTVPATAALFVEPGDVDALRGALARVIADAGLRATLARGAAEAGAALPTWPQAVARWLAALDRLTA
jgi:glycosyltransferase involved in cell wall biosynthesis